MKYLMNKFDWSYLTNTREYTVGNSASTRPAYKREYLYKCTLLYGLCACTGG